MYINVLCSENKGADQWCGCHAADLRLCFSHMEKANFLLWRLKCTLKKRFLITFQFLSRAKHLVRQINDEEKRLTRHWQAELGFFYTCAEQVCIHIREIQSNFEH